MLLFHLLNDIVITHHIVYCGCSEATTTFINSRKSQGELDKMMILNPMMMCKTNRG
jgi:hypothetical protein